MSPIARCGPRVRLGEIRLPDITAKQFTQCVIGCLTNGRFAQEYVKADVPRAAAEMIN